MALEVDIEKKAGDFSLCVSFAADEGILGILGASGCGKSMTLKCIAGIEKPDRGRIVLDEQVLYDSEKNINLPPQKRHVGYLFQNYALFPNMTVRQNIMCGLHFEKDKQKKEAEAMRVMEMLQLEGVSSHRPHQLSGGQAQRAALGRILVNKPGLLMLDEPFSALDTHLRLKLQMELRKLLGEYGRGVLMVTHDRDEAFRMCDRIGIMDNGRMQSVRPTKALFADPGTIEAASLTGCKNIMPAVKTDENEVYVPGWNIHLTTAKPVKDGLSAVGVRAHYYHPAAPANSYPITVVREMEEPFEWVTEFRYEGQAEESPAVWWRYSKEKRPAKLPVRLGIAPANILLLYEDKTVT
ncbi:MAG: ATP-binding cassette domain-containing protein [Lachnospiraceae bacterium]|nr:ATP-binding cassette domain-containing protein [Lachnospiraceae bacterium]